MKFGLLLTGGYLPGSEKRASQIYWEVMDDAVLAEELGYHNLWVAEHHFDARYAPNPFILCSAIATRTSRIRIGTNIAIMPLCHPVRIAENTAMLDALSNGRFNLGLGLGYDPKEFTALKVPLSQRGSIMEEGLQIIKGLLTQECFSFQGNHFNLDRVALVPRPIQKPHPPIWAAAEVLPKGERIPKPLARAARHGCHLTGPNHPRLLRLYEQALGQYGYNPQDFFRCCIRVGYVAETRYKAWADYSLPLMAYKQHLNVGRRATVENVAQLGKEGKLLFLGKRPIVGTPEDAIREIESDQQAGITHSLVWMHLGGLDTDKTRQSMSLFAQEVIPAFSSSLTALVQGLEEARDE